MGVKMNSRIITKSDAGDPEIGFLTKSISKPYGRATAMPTAWELGCGSIEKLSKIISNFKIVLGTSNFVFVGTFYRRLRI